MPSSTAVSVASGDAFIGRAAPAAEGGEEVVTRRDRCLREAVALVQIEMSAGQKHQLLGFASALVRFECLLVRGDYVTRRHDHEKRCRGNPVDSRSRIPLADQFEAAQSYFVLPVR